MLYDLRHTFGTRQETELKNGPFYVSRGHGSCEPANDHAVVHPDQPQQRQATERWRYLFCLSSSGHFPQGNCDKEEESRRSVVTKMTIEISRLRLI